MIKIDTSGEISKHVNRFCEKAFGAKTIQCAALKLAEEAGEVCGAANKMKENRATIHNLRDEIGDALILLVQLCSLAGITMESAIYRRFRKIVNRMISADFTDSVPDTPVPKKFPDPPEGFTFIGPSPVLIDKNDSPEDVMSLDITRPEDGWSKVEKYRPAEFWNLYAARTGSLACIRMIGHGPTEATADVLAGILQEDIKETLMEMMPFGRRIERMYETGDLREAIRKAILFKQDPAISHESIWGMIEVKNYEQRDLLDGIAVEITRQVIMRLENEVLYSKGDGYPETAS